LSEFGGGLYAGSEAQNFAEVDLIVLTSTVTAVAECKDFDTFNDRALQEIEQSLERNLVAAMRMEANLLFVGVTTREADARLFELGQRFLERIETLPIASHLILNGALHLNWQAEATELRGLTLEHLRPRTPSISEMNSVGELSSSIGFGSVRSALDEEPLRAFEIELGVG
jgi:hypothetical protein